MRLVSKLVLAGILVAAPAFANEPRMHDKGFFLRLSGGVGGAKATVDDDGQDNELTGTCGDVNFAVGAMVANNLALHGTLAGWSVSEPEFSIDGDEVADLDDTSMNYSMIGAGLTYWFMPVNMYLSGSVGAATMDFEVDGDGGDVTFESDTGLGVDLTLGKEWWVSNKWGLGMAAGVSLSSVGLEDTDNDLKGTSFSIRFSATYN